MVRKAVTPIISTVLLLMLVVAIFGLTYMFVSGTTMDANEQVGDQIAAATDKASEQFVIESTWNETSSGNLTFMLRNTGSYTFPSADVGKFSAYIDGEPITISAVGTGDFAPATTRKFTTNHVYKSSEKLKVVAPKGSFVVYIID